MPRSRLAILEGLVVSAVLIVTAPPRAAAQTGALHLAIDSTSPTTVPVSSTAYATHLTVSETGAPTERVQVKCDAGGAVECVPLATNQLDLVAGSSTALTVAYRTKRPGRGVVWVRVRDLVTGARASAALLVTVTP